MPWARFVLAHCPALGDAVLQGTRTLRGAVQSVKDSSGCEVGCGHQPLTKEEEGLLRGACLAQGLSDEQADVLIAWNPQLRGAAVAS